MNRRDFMTRMFMGSVTLPLFVDEPKPEVPVQPMEWWVSPNTYTSGYCQVIDPEWDGNPSQFTITNCTIR